jgi:hypothetical protein
MAPAFIATLDTIGDYVAHIGEEALAFPDPSGDFGRYFVFRDTPKGREFLCIVENEDRLGFDRSNLALVARQAQDKFVRESRADLRRIKNRIRPETLVDAHLELAARNAPELASQAVDVIHNTAALAAASAALDLANGRVAPAEPHSAAILEEGEEILKRQSAWLAARAAELSDEELDLLWCKVRRTGAALSDRESAFLARHNNSAESWSASYESTSDYRAMRRLERFVSEQRVAS